MYLLRHIQYGAVTLVFLVTVIKHKYSGTGCLYWGVLMSSTTLQTADLFLIASAAKIHLRKETLYLSLETEKEV